MITTENADKALKEYYLEAVSTQLNDGISPFFAAIEKTSNNVYGKDVNLIISRGSGGSIVATSEDGDLPGTIQNRYLTITVPLKNIYGTIEVSDKALRASRDSSGAFVNLINAEMESLIACGKQNFQRMLFGDGSGKLCNVVKVTSDTKSVTVDVAKDYYSGMTVDLITTSGTIPADCSKLVISSVDVWNKKITFETSITSAVAGASMYIHGAKDNELTGLGAIFKSDTLYGHNRYKEMYFNSNIVDGDELPLTEDKLIEIIDEMEEFFNSRINMIVCSYATRRKIASLISNGRRVVNSIDARTGVGVVTVNNIPVYAERYCSDDEIMFLNTDDFCLNQLCDWEWLEDESGKILKQIPGKAAYSATLVKYAELICKKPCGQALLYNFALTDKVDTTD